MAKIDVAKFPEYLRGDVEVMLLLGMSAEEIKAKCLELMKARQTAEGKPATGATAQTVDSDFIKAVKAIRLKHDADTRAAKVNGEKPPASAKIPSLAHGQFTVGAKAGWLCTSLGFNGTLAQAKELMAILPEAVAYYDANAQYAELTAFVASLK